MNPNQYISIDGLKVNRAQPFVIYPAMPRNSSGFNFSEEGKSDHNLTNFAKNLFNSTNDQIQEIDQHMLRYRSVSSLRDFALFSPPMATREEEESAVEKKTIFLNEFPLFEYIKQ